MLQCFPGKNKCHLMFHLFSFFFLVKHSVTDKWHWLNRSFLIFFHCYLSNLCSSHSCIEITGPENLDSWTSLEARLGPDSADSGLGHYIVK